MSISIPVSGDLRDGKQFKLTLEKRNVAYYTLFFRPFRESIFLAVAWPEKGKIRIFVSCLTDNAVMTMHLTIGVTPSGSQRHVSRQRRQNSIARDFFFFFLEGGGWGLSFHNNEN